MITKTYDLDMHSGGVPVIVHLSQYDEDFSLVFNLFSSVGTFTVESGTTAAIRGTKKDGMGYSVDATLDVTNKKVTVAGDQQMTAVAGRQVFELTLTKSDKELNTANFILDVERAALDKDTLASESVIKELVDVIDRTDEIIAAANQAETATEQAEEVIRAYTLLLVDAHPASGATPLEQDWLEDEQGTAIVPDDEHVYILREAQSPYLVNDQFRWSGDTYVKMLDGGGQNVPKTTTTPKMDGTASIGSESKYAAGDHIHPTDTSRAPINSPAFTGTPTAPTPDLSSDGTDLATTAFVKDVSVLDVEVDGTSVVSDGVASITSPNAFGNVKVGSSTIESDQSGDTLELVAGDNIALTADTTNDKVTIAGDYSDATTSASGLMSAADKGQVDKIGNTTMGTTATTITGAIAEHESDITSLEGDRIKIVESVSLGSISVNASGAADATVDISSSIPSGYKLAAAIPRGTGSYGFYFYLCSKASDTSVRVTLFRATGTGASVSPNIGAICVKA